MASEDMLLFRDPFRRFRVESRWGLTDRGPGKIENIRRTNERELQDLLIFVIIEEAGNGKALQPAGRPGLESLVDR